MRPTSIAILFVAAALAASAPAGAAPVATDDDSYGVLGRVFPDPLAGCQFLSRSPCDPGALGNVPATQFIQWEELAAGLRYMNSRWPDLMEVLVLDGEYGPGSATRAQVEADPARMFEGNNLTSLEFDPRPEYRSAGLPTSTLARNRSDLVLVRVTDERVSDAGKRRMALSLSIHGIERAGAEGGTRALEELVTAAATGNLNAPVLRSEVTAGNPTFPRVPTFGEVLQKTIVYFTYPNPDGWRRGAISEGGVFFQRYNGNGVDPNRDYADIGFSFRDYSGYSEPETRAFRDFYLRQLAEGRSFAAADDLHGQPHADALSYTLMPHGRHDFGKDLRIREAAKLINRAQYHATKWSPLIQDNDQPLGGVGRCAPGVNQTCARIYAQTWGTVFDTIAYTTTGSLGDWFDSTTGLGADGIDNEMSFSHLDKNIVFEPHTEQLHVAGNKAIIYAHLAAILDPPNGRFEARGRKGYVAGTRVVRGARAGLVGPPPNTVAQADIEDAEGTLDQSTPTRTIFEWTVRRTAPSPGAPGVFNGGMRVDVTQSNVQGIGATATLVVQCRFCDDHVGTRGDVEWVTVASDFDQAPPPVSYYQAGLTAAVNRPQAFAPDGRPIEWRAVVSAGGGTPRLSIDFTSEPATVDGNDGGDSAPIEAAYDVANTDFFADLNRFIDTADERLAEVDPRAVLAGTATLAGLDVLALADDPLPGYTGRYKGQPGAQPADTGSYTPAEKDAWMARLRTWVSGGGTLVLTDRALVALPELVAISQSAIVQSAVYVGSIAFNDGGLSTLDDPLAAQIAQPGARSGGGNRRQMFEPVPLGYPIQTQAAPSVEFPGSRQHQVGLLEWRAVGGRTVGSAGGMHATLGELALGAGRIRIAGALLPQPTEAYDHPLGLEPYAVTYSGYILARNLLDAPTTGGQQAAAADGAAVAHRAGATCRDRAAPRALIRARSLRASGHGIAVAGAATDRGCGGGVRLRPGRVARVEVALASRLGDGCRFVRTSGRMSRRRSCARPVWLRAAGRTQWGFATERLLPRGRYTARARAVDGAGNVGRATGERAVRVGSR